MVFIVTQALGRVVIWPTPGMDDGATISPEIFTFPMDFGLVVEAVTFTYDLGELV